MLIYTSTKSKPKRKSRYKPSCVYEKAKKPEFRELKRPLYSREERQSDRIPSAALPPPKTVLPTRYEGEMALREAAAQEEIARKRKMVAPICNKGGYQYIGDAPPEIVKTLGRKV